MLILECDGEALGVYLIHAGQFRREQKIPLAGAPEQ